jgi:hypothetical protein
MTDKEALIAFANQQKLDQLTVKRLHRAGYIEAISGVTNLQSTEQEWFPTFITEKGRRLLEST